MPYNRNYFFLFLIACGLVSGGTVTANAGYVYDGFFALSSTAGSTGGRGIDFEDGLLYVANNGMGTVEVINTATSSVTQTIQHSYYTVGIDADTSGAVWMMDGSVGFENGGTSELGVWVADSTSTTFSKAFIPERPAYAIAHASNGMVITSSMGDNIDGGIFLYDSTGTKITSTNNYGGYAIALNADDSKIYLARGMEDAGNAMDKYSVYTLTPVYTGGIFTDYTVSSFSFADEMCYDPAALPPSGNTSEDFHVTGVTTDGDGNIWIATRNRSASSVYSQFNAVLKFAPDGTLLDKFNGWDPETGETYFELNYTDRVALREKTLGCLFGITYDEETDTVYVSGNYTAGDSRSCYQIPEENAGDVYILTFKGVEDEEFIPGDANKDGKVDGSDVTILAGNWQTLTNATWGMGDFNGDGKVDGSDVTILAGNWQSGTTSAAASVPEPSTVLLFATLVFGFLCWRRR